MIKERCGFFQINVFLENFPSRFYVLCLGLISSTCTDKNSPLARLTRNIPNLKPFPNRVPIELSRIAFPMVVLPKGDRTDSVQEERLGLRYWTMILAICVVVDESKCLDIPIWEFSVIWVHPPFLHGKKQILHLLLVHRNLAIWR